MGIVAEVIANNTRKPLWGYRSMVYSLVFLGFMSFIVWAHHMFMTGMGTAMAAFFQTTTMIISIPSVVILTALVISLWGGSIRFNTPMLFALGFLPMFGIGGLTGLPLGLQHRGHPAARHLLRHRPLPLRRRAGDDLRALRGDLLLVPEGHRPEDERDARQDPFLGSFICMNVVFMPMFIIGLAGVSRRLYDGGAAYDFAQPVLHWNVVSSWGAWVLGALPDSLHLQLLLEHPEGGEDRATTRGRPRPSSGPRPRRRRTATSSRRRRRIAGPTSTAFPGAAKDFSPQYEA